MATRLLTVAYGPPATALLGRIVGAGQAGDPLAPVTVVVPSAAAGVTLRRWPGPTGGSRSGSRRSSPTATS
jgi:hypothetical protein